MSTLSPQVLEKLRKFDTPTICNLIELFDIRPRNLGYMDARIKAAFPEMPPMVGFAATATFRSAAPPRRRRLLQRAGASRTLRGAIRPRGHRLPRSRRTFRRRYLRRGHVHDLQGLRLDRLDLQRHRP